MAGLLADQGNVATAQDQATPQPQQPAAPPVSGQRGGLLEAGEEGPRTGPVVADSSRSASGEDTGADPAEMLSQIRQQVTDRLPAEMLRNIDRIVIAGQRIMFDEKSNRQLLDQIDQMPGESQPAKVANGVAAIMSIIENNERGPLDPRSVIAASALILCDAIEFLAQIGRFEPTRESIGEATQTLMASMMQKYRMDPNKVRAEAQQQQAQQQGGQPDGLLGGQPPTQRGAAGDPMAGPPAATSGTPPPNPTVGG